MYAGGGYGSMQSGGMRQDFGRPSPLEYMASTPSPVRGTVAYASASAADAANNYGSVQPYASQGYAERAYASTTETASYAPATNYVAPKDDMVYHLAQRQEMASAAFAADDFLDPHRPRTPFVGNAEEVRPHVEEAFRLLMGSELPHDIIIRIGSEEQLAMAYPGQWESNIAGFALNRVGWGTSEIFARKDEMDRLLLTIGHELGHVMSQPLPRIHDEEGKAFAFSLAWMKTIKDNNIAGIGHAINPNPARNGLHDVAFNFVADLVEKGKAAMDVFSELAHRVLSVR